MKGAEIIGTTAAELMEFLDGDPTYTKEAEIAEVMIVVRIQDQDENEEWSTIQWRASDPIWTHKLGLLQGALEGMEHYRRRESDSEAGDD